MRQRGVGQQRQQPNVPSFLPDTGGSQEGRGAAGQGRGGYGGSGKGTGRGSAGQPSAATFGGVSDTGGSAGQPSATVGEAYSGVAVGYGSAGQPSAATPYRDAMAPVYSPMPFGSVTAAQAAAIAARTAPLIPAQASGPTLASLQAIYAAEPGAEPPVGDDRSESIGEPDDEPDLRPRVAELTEHLRQAWRLVDELASQNWNDDTDGPQFSGTLSSLDDRIRNAVRIWASRPVEMRNHWNVYVVPHETRERCSRDLLDRVEILVNNELDRLEPPEASRRYQQFLEAIDFCDNHADTMFDNPSLDPFSRRGRLLSRQARIAITLAAANAEASALAELESQNVESAEQLLERFVNLAEDNLGDVEVAEEDHAISAGAVGDTLPPTPATTSPLLTPVGSTGDLANVTGSAGEPSATGNVASGSAGQPSAAAGNRQVSFSSAPPEVVEVTRQPSTFGIEREYEALTQTIEHEYDALDRSRARSEQPPPPTTPPPPLRAFGSSGPAHSSILQSLLEVGRSAPVSESIRGSVGVELAMDESSTPAEDPNEHIVPPPPPGPPSYPHPDDIVPAVSDVAPPSVVASVAASQARGFSFSTVDSSHAFVASSSSSAPARPLPPPTPPPSSADALAARRAARDAALASVGGPGSALSDWDRRDVFVLRNGPHGYVPYCLLCWAWCQDTTHAKSDRHLKRLRGWGDDYVSQRMGDYADWIPPENYNRGPVVTPKASAPPPAPPMPATFFPPTPAALTQEQLLNLQSSMLSQHRAAVQGVSASSSSHQPLQSGVSVAPVQKARPPPPPVPPFVSPPPPMASAAGSGDVAATVAAMQQVTLSSTSSKATAPPPPPPPTPPDTPRGSAYGSVAPPPPPPPRSQTPDAADPSPPADPGSAAQASAVGEGSGGSAGQPSAAAGEGETLTVRDDAGTEAASEPILDAYLAANTGSDEPVSEEPAPADSIVIDDPSAPIVDDSLFVGGEVEPPSPVEQTILESPVLSSDSDIDFDNVSRMPLPGQETATETEGTSSAGQPSAAVPEGTVAGSSSGAAAGEAGEVGSAGQPSAATSPATPVVAVRLGPEATSDPRAAPIRTAVPPASQVVTPSALGSASSSMLLTDVAITEFAKIDASWKTEANKAKAKQQLLTEQLKKQKDPDGPFIGLTDTSNSAHFCGQSYAAKSAACPQFDVTIDYFDTLLSGIDAAGRAASSHGAMIGDASQHVVPGSSHLFLPVEMPEAIIQELSGNRPDEPLPSVPIVPRLAQPLARVDYFDRSLVPTVYNVEARKSEWYWYLISLQKWGLATKSRPESHAFHQAYCQVAPGSNRPALGLINPLDLLSQFFFLLKEIDLVWILGNRIASLCDFYHGLSSENPAYPPPPTRFTHVEHLPNAFISDSMWGLMHVENPQWHEFVSVHSILMKRGWRNHIAKIIPSSNLCSLSLALLAYLEFVGVGTDADGNMCAVPFDRGVIMSWSLSEMDWDEHGGYMVSSAMCEDIRRFCVTARYIPALLICVGGDLPSYNTCRSAQAVQDCIVKEFHKNNILAIRGTGLVRELAANVEARHVQTNGRVDTWHFNLTSLNEGIVDYHARVYMYFLMFCTFPREWMTKEHLLCEKIHKELDFDLVKREGWRWPPPSDIVRPLTLRMQQLAKNRELHKEAFHRVQPTVQSGGTVAEAMARAETLNRSLDEPGEEGRDDDHLQDAFDAANATSGPEERKAQDIWVYQGKLTVPGEGTTAGSAGQPSAAAVGASTRGGSAGIPSAVAQVLASGEAGSAGQPSATGGSASSAGPDLGSAKESLFSTRSKRKGGALATLREWAEHQDPGGSGFSLRQFTKQAKQLSAQVRSQISAPSPELVDKIMSKRAAIAQQFKRPLVDEDIVDVVARRIEQAFPCVIAPMTSVANRGSASIWQVLASVTGESDTHPCAIVDRGLLAPSVAFGPVAEPESMYCFQTQSVDGVGNWLQKGDPNGNTLRDFVAYDLRLSDLSRVDSEAMDLTPTPWINEIGRKYSQWGKLSRKLTTMLRHGAVREGIPIDAGGWVPWPAVRYFMQIDDNQLAGLCREIMAQEKNRIQVLLMRTTTADAQPIYPPGRLPNGCPPLMYYDEKDTFLVIVAVRAMQGHSIKFIAPERCFFRFLPEHANLISCLCHGTVIDAVPKILYGDLVPGGDKKFRNESHFTVFLPWDPRYAAGMRHDSEIFILYDMAILAEFVFWISPIGAALTRDVIPSRFIIAIFTYSHKFGSITFWWHRDVRNSGIHPTGVDESTRQRSEEWVAKHGRAVPVPMERIKQHSLFANPVVCSICGEPNCEGICICFKCYAGFKWDVELPGSAGKPSAAGSSSGSAGQPSATVAPLTTKGPATTREITMTLLADLIAASESGPGDASAAPATSSRSSFSSALAPISPFEVRMLKYRGMTRRVSAESVRKIIREQKSLRKHRAKWTEDAAFRAEKSASGWIWAVCGMRVDAGWVVNDLDVRQLPVDSGYTCWDHAEDVNMMVAFMVLDGSTGESPDFEHKRALIDEFVYANDSQLSVLEAWKKGESVRFEEPDEPQADPPLSKKQKKKAKAKAAATKQEGEVSEEESTVVEPPAASAAPSAAASSSSAKRARRTLPPLANWDASSQRVRVATAFLALISELNLVSAQLVPFSGSLSTGGFSGSTFFYISFDGMVGFAYLLVVHLLAFFGLFSLIRSCCTCWRSGNPKPSLQDDAVSSAVQTYMAMRRDDLVKACRIRGLHISGTKEVLAQRLAHWSPSDVSGATPPSDAQLAYLLRLEVLTNCKAAPTSLVSRTHCSAELDRLRALLPQGAGENTTNQ